VPSLNQLSALWPRQLDTLGKNIGRVGGAWFSRCGASPAAAEGFCCAGLLAGGCQGSFGADTHRAAKGFAMPFGRLDIPA